MTSARERVLVLRALGLGDTYAAVPALRGVRRRWPGAEIVLAAPADLGQLMVRHGLVDRVLPTVGLTPPLPWEGRPPEVAVNLHGSGPESHRALMRLSPRTLVGFYCQAVGFVSGPEWDDDEHEVDRWCRLVTTTGGECSPTELTLPRLDSQSPVVAQLPMAPVVIHPGAASEARRWPPERWARVAAALAEDGWPVVVTGGPGERAICAQVAAVNPDVVDASGDFQLADLAALVGRARLVLCGDTGVAHLATAYGTPSVLLFGPTAPQRWGPRIDSAIHRVLWRPNPADPPGDPHGRRVDVRLLRITVEDVLGECRRMPQAVASVPQHQTPPV